MNIHALKILDHFSFHFFSLDFCNVLNFKFQVSLNAPTVSALHNCSGKKAVIRPADVVQILDDREYRVLGVNSESGTVVLRFGASIPLQINAVLGDIHPQSAFYLYQPKMPKFSLMNPPPITSAKYLHHPHFLTLPTPQPFGNSTLMNILHTNARNSIRLTN